MIEVTTKVYAKDNHCLLRTETKFYERTTIQRQIDIMSNAIKVMNDNISVLHQSDYSAIILDESEDFIQYITLSKLELEVE